MTIKFTLFSQEVEDFVLEIIIDADARFAELHQIIMRECQYAEHPRQCFMVCDEDWHIIQRVLLQDNDTMKTDEDIYLMSDTSLREFIDDKGQHLAYRFDPEGRRHFLLDVTDCLFGQPCYTANVCRRHGDAPTQFLIEEEILTPKSSVQRNTGTSTTEYDENFYGDDGFEAEELDEEGFEISE